MTFDHVTQRTDHQALSLNWQQLANLVTGETGEDEPGKLEEKITEKQSSLPIPYLIEDAALLRTAEFTDVEAWEVAWEDIVESAGGNSAYSPPRAIKRVHEDDFPVYQFGIQLGHLAKLLPDDRIEELLVAHRIRLDIRLR